MSREHLYRGKRVDNNEWAYGHLVESECRQYHAFIVVSADWEVSDKDVELLATEIYEVIPETVGEWTGMEDKDENKIFEDDIIKQKDCMHDGKIQIKGESFVIKYENNMFLAKSKSHWNFIKNFELYLEVVGNIHDNPELLK